MIKRVVVFVLLTLLATTTASAQFLGTPFPKMTFIGSAEGASTGTTDITVSLAGIPMLIGDLVIGFSGQAAASDCNINTTGYTSMTGSGTQFCAEWKVLTAVDADIVCEAAAANTGSACLAMVFRLPNPVTQPDVDMTTASGTSTTPDSPSNTPVTAEAPLISSFCSIVSDTTVTAPTGFEGQVDINANATTTDITCGMAWTRALVTAAFDPPSWTGVTSASWAAITMIFRPLR